MLARAAAVRFRAANCSANMDRLELFALPASERLPVLNEIGIQTVINGPIPVSADGEPIMGLAPELDNFYRRLRLHRRHRRLGRRRRGDGQLDRRRRSRHGPLAVRRAPFRRPQAQAGYLEERAIEAYGAYYKIHWPGEENEAGRGLRRSPLHEHLKAVGAVFGARFGFERPLCFPDPGDDPEKCRASRTDRAGSIGRKGAPANPRARGADRPDILCQIHHRRSWRHVLSRRDLREPHHRRAGGAASTRPCSTSAAASRPR